MGQTIGYREHKWCVNNSDIITLLQTRISFSLLMKQSLDDELVHILTYCYFGATTKLSA